VSVLALLTVVRADPVETVLLSFYSFDKMFAGYYSIGDLAFLGAGVLITIDISLLILFNRHIVTKLAPFSLLAHALFKHRAENLFLFKG
jgi:hypothetical protein